MRIPYVPDSITTGESELAARHNPKRIILTGVSIIAVSFGLFALWATLAPLDSAVLAQGVIKVDTNRKTVQHLEGGIVKKILVKEGEVVRKGQELIILDEEQVKASVDLLEGQLAAEAAAVARLHAEKNGLPEVTFPAKLLARAKDPAIDKILQAESKLFHARRNALESQIELLKNQIRQTTEEIAGQTEQLKGTTKSIESISEQLASNRMLQKDGYVSKTVVLELERLLAEKTGLKGELAAAIAKSQQKKIESELRITSLKSAYLQEAAKELKDVEGKRLDLEDRVRGPRNTLQRQVITAPIAGRVVDLKVHTVGGVIASKEPLMDIVPLDNQLIVEGRVGVDSINDLRLNQEAEVSLTAYHQSITPRVQGTVTYISADRLTDKNVATPMPPYYIVYVDIDRKSLQEAGNLELYPGMSAQLAIKVRSRTALEYFLEPLTTRISRGFREP